jgi:hypothetical protein
MVDQPSRPGRVFDQVEQSHKHIEHSLSPEIVLTDAMRFVSGAVKQAVHVDRSDRVYERIH